MKRYLTVIMLLVLGYSILSYSVYYNGDLFLKSQKQVRTISKAKDGKLWIDKDGEFEVFEIKGVNLGLGKPGKFATDYAITEDEYLRWFKQIKEMGANTIRTYTLAHQTFYDAFYKYNKDNPDPLYLIHGVWVEDYLLNSHRGALEDSFYEPFLQSCKDVIDAVHGRHKNATFEELGVQNYTKDISPWVYGYIAGVEWEGDIVAYTNNSVEQHEQYKGKYLETEDAANFEIFLAMIGDEMISYETDKYATQKVVAFSNWPATDPMEYYGESQKRFKKYAKVDVENIKTTELFLSGHYASYHIYPYYPEYQGVLDPDTQNTYLAYLEVLNEHHEIPVVISEFGIPASRGRASYEDNRSLARDQGYMTEKQQGEAVISLYEDIMTAGSAGGIIFMWQDEWFKRTWNTIPYVDLENNIKWSDYQTNEQYFGLMSFDPGKDRSVAYVDGNTEEWKDEDIVVNSQDYSLSMKYDEKFIYMMIEADEFDIEEDKIYIPIDLTPKSGSKYVECLDIHTDYPTDFVIEINGMNDSRIWVHERYNSLTATKGDMIFRNFNQFENKPKIDSTLFQKIDMMLYEMDYFDGEKEIEFSQYNSTNPEHYALAQTYETGKLTYGNANPSSEEFNSLADFYSKDNCVEIRIPWGLLNFSNPADLEIHDDYYIQYGVEGFKIDKLLIGVGDGKEEINMTPFKLKKLGNKPTYHERLKQSYYIIQSHWRD